MSSGWVFLQILQVIRNAPFYQLLLEGSLFAGVLWLIFHKTQSGRRKVSRQLTPQEKEQLIEEYTPEPLVDEVPSDHPALKPRIISGKAGLYIEVDGRRCINMATHNYLNFVGNAEIEEKAIQTVQKYGVGSCGPRGFYGTVDVHLELEEKLAKFMDMEEAAVYSYNFSTIASAIPAYAKRGDIIFVDESVNFAIQKGLDASRAKLCFFKHNNMEYLEKLLMLQEEIDQKNPVKAKLKKKFLIVEGIYMNTGQICNLPRLIELRKKYKLRLFVDEDISFGTLGKHGRGVTEYYNVDKSEVDLIVCSMEGALGTIGGFCIGSSFIVEHQRLSGLGYCFSASLPPLLTSAAICAIDMMKKDPEMFVTLMTMCKFAHKVLGTVESLIIYGSCESPVKHLLLATPLESKESEEMTLNNIVHYCAENGIALVLSTYLPSERFSKRPSIRITINRAISKSEIERVAKTLDTACKSCALEKLE